MGKKVFPREDAIRKAAATISGRELEVLQHLERGLTSKEIGQVLSISEHTVKGHLKLIFSKLGASNRAEAVARCHEASLL